MTMAYSSFFIPFMSVSLALVNASAFVPILLWAPLPPSIAMSSFAAASRAAGDQPTQEWDVARYQSQHSFVYQYGTSLVDLVQPVPGERILDIGCGSGELTQALYKAAASSSRRRHNSNTTSNENNNNNEQPPNLLLEAAEVIGIDADANMIQKAQQQYPHLQFVQADIRTLNLSQLQRVDDDDDDRPVDVIFSNAALHWIPPSDAPRMVQAMARCMKPGARFVVEFGGKDNIQQIITACEQVTGIQNTWWYFPSIGEFCSLLEQYGDLQVTSALWFDRPTVLEDGERGLENWIRMFGTKFLEGLHTPNSSSSSSSSKEELIQQTLDAISDKLRPTLWDGSQWTADYKRIRVTGHKKM